ncbi:hypothetical protein [Siccirubricoccus sp. G192]|uniref:hypothetical protein n=1 Tax=Siccirubricoccus sp. G192 TaxID=2849651 RepID=UPI001C2BA7BC|nr:hypothetical protein [Siccirubricoccus sp. G192]MBV1798750.1 hypothetical protein [Siccirubricoccus sp. G192]
MRARRGQQRHAGRRAGLDILDGGDEDPITYAGAARKVTIELADGADTGIALVWNATGTDIKEVESAESVMLLSAALDLAVLHVEAGTPSCL